MESEACETVFLEPEDLVHMGLYRNKGHVFRAIKRHGNIPPYVRISKKNIRFPFDGFQRWLQEQTAAACSIIEKRQHRGGMDVRS